MKLKKVCRWLTVWTLSLSMITGSGSFMALAEELTDEEVLMVPEAADTAADLFGDGNGTEAEIFADGAEEEPLLREEEAVDFDYTGMNFDEDGNVLYYTSQDDLVFAFNRDPGDVKIDWFVGSYTLENGEYQREEAFPEDCYSVSPDAKSVTLHTDKLRELLLENTGNAMFSVSAAGGEVGAWMTISFNVFDLNYGGVFDGDILRFSTAEKERTLAFNTDPGDMDIRWYIGTYHIDDNGINLDAAAPAECYSVAEDKKSVTLYGEELEKAYLKNTNSAAFMVQAFCSAGDEIRFSPWIEVNIYNSDSVPVMVKELKAVSASYNKIRVTWQKLDGVSGYTIMRKTQGSDWAEIGEAKASATSFTDKKAVTGTTYFYTVYAYRLEGKNRVKGAYNTAGVSAKASLAKVKGMTVTAGAKHQNVIKWNKTAGATGYQIYCKTGTKGKFVKLKTVKNATKFVHTGLKKGTKYTYKIRAYRQVSSKPVKNAYGAFCAAKSVKAK